MFCVYPARQTDFFLSLSFFLALLISYSLLAFCFVVDTMAILGANAVEYPSRKSEHHKITPEPDIMCFFFLNFLFFSIYLKPKFKEICGLSSSSSRGISPFYLFVNHSNGAFCLRFKWCLSFLWLICRHVRLTTIANAPIVIHMPNKYGKCTYQFSSSLIGFVDDAFILSTKSGFTSESVIDSVFHVVDWVVVGDTTATVLFTTSSRMNEKWKQKLSY